MPLEMENTRKNLPAKVAVYRVAVLVLGLLGGSIAMSPGLLANPNYLFVFFLVVLTASYGLVKVPDINKYPKKSLWHSRLTVIAVYLVITVGWLLGHWNDDKLANLPWLVLGYAAFTFMFLMIDKPLEKKS